MTRRLPNRYKRIDKDKYFTPLESPLALLQHLDLPGTIYDPACGQGHIVWAVERILPRSRIEASDIEISLPWQAGVEPEILDFLSLQALNRDWGRTTIFTNPPFGERGKLAERFIVHAVELTAAAGGAVVMLLPSDFDHAVTRTSMFGDCPLFAGQYKHLWRLKWANLEDMASPMENHSWFVWDWRKPPDREPWVRYLPKRKGPQHEQGQGEDQDAAQDRTGRARAA